MLLLRCSSHGTFRHNHSERLGMMTGHSEKQALVTDFNLPILKKKGKTTGIIVTVDYAAFIQEL